MIKQFPEIEAFFLQDIFTEDDLDILKNNIAATYKNTSLQAKALSLIELFLIKFQLSTEQELKDYKAERKISRTRSVRKKKISTAKTTGGNTSLNNDYKSQLGDFKKITVNEICKDLGLSEVSMNRFLKQQKLPPINGNRLTQEQFDGLKEVFIAKIKVKERKIIANKRMNKKVKRSDIKKKKSNSSVYSKIKASGGTGKLIYIRSR